MDTCPLCKSPTEMHEVIYDAADNNGNHIQTERYERFCTNKECEYFNEEIW